MSTIDSAYVNAPLADASYVDGLAPGDAAPDLLDKASPRMTPTLAKLILLGGAA